MHHEVTASYNGWHDLVLQVSGGVVKYYIDGALFAEHGGIYYPETVQSVNFNLWFISGGLVGAPGDRAYQQHVDYVYFAKDQVLSPAQVQSKVTGYRSSGVDHVDTVPAS